MYRDKERWKCVGCHPACLKCTERWYNTCTVCKKGYDLYNKTICAAECPHTFYSAPMKEKIKDAGGICKKCDPACHKCFGPSKK